MAYQKKNQRVWQQQKRVDTIFDLIEDGAAEDLLELTQNTEIKYLKDGEEEWLKTRSVAGQYDGIHTGYDNVDSLTGSFLPGELFTVGGDTGHGKSLFAMNIAQNVYKNYLRPVLMVNLELTEEQARGRFYDLSGEDHDYSGIMIQKAPAVSYRDIDILMKKAKEEDACFVVIDHLHFFSRSADNQANEISRIMKHFKECAVENKLPVMLLSHVTPTRIMSPTGSVKKTIKPNLHNFKGSSSIEQDSDMVGFVFRSDDQPSRVEFYMRKNRSRPKIIDSVYFDQVGWELKEDKLWVPKNLSPFGV